MTDLTPDEAAELEYDEHVTLEQYAYWQRVGAYGGVIG